MLRDRKELEESLRLLEEEFEKALEIVPENADEDDALTKYFKDLTDDINSLKAQLYEDISPC